MKFLDVTPMEILHQIVLMRISLANGDTMSLEKVVNLQTVKDEKLSNQLDVSVDAVIQKLIESTIDSGSISDRERDVLESIYQYVYIFLLMRQSKVNPN